MFNTKRFISVLVGAVAVAMVATSCASVPAEQLTGEPYAVQATVTDVWTGDLEFAFTDTEGVQNALQGCVRENVWKATITCESENGQAIFRYDPYKGEVTKASLTVDGSLVKLDCTRDVAPSSVTVCLPVK